MNNQLTYSIYRYTTKVVAIGIVYNESCCHRYTTKSCCQKKKERKFSPTSLG